MKSELSQVRPLRTIAYSDQILFSADFTGKSNLSVAAKNVALAILQYVNLKAGCTHTDPLTLAKRLKIELSILRKAIACLVENGHLKTARHPDYTTPLLIPVLKPNDTGMHSQRGDKAFYRARGELIRQMIFDRRMTPAERITGVTFAALADPESWECDTSLSQIARHSGLSRITLRNAVEKLATLRYIAVTATKGDGSRSYAVDLGMTLDSTLDTALDSRVTGNAHLADTSGQNSVYSEDSIIVAGRDVVKEEEPSSVVRLPDATAVARWRRTVYAFLITDGPICGVHSTEMAMFIESGLLTSSGEITALGHAIGAPATSTKEAIAV